MKKKFFEKFRKVSIFLLAAVLLLSAGYFGAMHSSFADSDEDDDEEKRKPSAEVYTKFAVGKDEKSAGGSSLNIASNKRYVLEVSTGMTAGNCGKTIIVRYYASEADKKANIVSTQYLTPGSAECLQWKHYVPQKLMVSNSVWSNFATAATVQESFFYSYAWELLGNKSYNYRDFVVPINSNVYGRSTDGGSWYYHDDQYSYSRMFNQYVRDARALMPSTVEGEDSKKNLQIGGFPMVENKVQDMDLFEPCSTDYIVFRSEYGIYELVSLDFYCETATETESWMIQGWGLYETDWESNFRYGINNYAFVSDRMAFDIKYDRCLGKSVPECVQDGFNVLYSGYYRFVKDTQQNRDAKNDKGTQLYYYFFNVPGGEADKSPVTYTFQVNIADVYGAGIESFNRTPAPNSKLELSEFLTATITYNNKDGFVQDLSLPVISNAVFEYTIPTYEADAGKDKSTPVFDYTRKEYVSREYHNYNRIMGNQLLSAFQQGDSIVFSVTFPEEAEITAVKLSYDNPQDLEDALVIEDIRVYDNPESRYVNRDLYDSADDLQLQLTPQGKLIYESDQVSGGVTLDAVNLDYEFEMQPAGQGQKNVHSYEGTYLFSFTTSSLNFTDTLADDIYVRFEYLSELGQEMSTQEYNLKDLTMDYYGYNPAYDSASGSITDGSYYYNMGRGRTLRFLVDLQNVGKFTKIVFTKGDILDEWQISGIEIRDVSRVGKRILTPLDNETCGDLVLNRIYDRNVDGSVIFSKKELSVLIQPNSTVEFELENANVDVNIEKRDYRDYYYSMNYEMATSDLHFDEAAWNYEVRVHVSPNSILTSANKGDSNGCGSNNLYYFQLVFADGTSGYILSNALLKSDCFRAGETETFTVSLNENMGDLVAINIIPDDVSEECDPLDKLSIDYIEVIRDNPKTVNKRYVCSNVGWVKLEYQDVEESLNAPGRSESQIATICPVTSSAYMLDLEFCIGVDEYYDRYGVELTQFQGNVLADIVYITSSGERKTIRDYPVVEKMYEYAGKTPKTATYGDGQEYYVSDPEFMFRGGHVARFLVSVDDAQIIDSITFYTMGYKNCVLPVKDLSVSIVKSSGRRIINSEGDYQMIYDVDPILLTDEVRGTSLPRQYSVVKDTYTPIRLNFGDNKIEELDDSTKLEEIIGRVPKSSNDKLNLYLYMAEGARTPDEAGYNLTVNTYYSSVVSSDIYMSSCDSLKTRRENGRLVLYATDLSATNMSGITSLQVTSNVLGTQYDDVLVDYGVVQQVRNGVVISTYKIKFGGAYVARTAKGISMQNKISSLGYEQVVSLALDEKTSSAKLTNEKYDIALAIRYTSTNSSDNTVFISPYVFATDSGEASIEPGKMLEFRFKESYVRDIVGIDVIAVNMDKGGNRVGMANANVLCYKSDENGKAELCGTYSLDESGQIYSEATKFSVTDNSMNGPRTLKRASFSFKTLQYSDNIDGGGAVPIKMIMNYTDVNKNIQTKVINDIRPYAGGNEYFTAGQNANISFFMKGVDHINYIKLIPYDNISASKATWNLESISFRIDGTEDTSFHSIPVNRTLVETTDDGNTQDDANDIFNLSSIKMTLTATVGENVYAGDELDEEISMRIGEEMQVLPVINGSVTGAYYVRVEKRGGNNFAQVGDTVELTDEGYSFLPTEAGNFRLIFTVTENPSIAKTVNIRVNP